MIMGGWEGVHPIPDDSGGAGTAAPQLTSADPSTRCTHCSARCHNLHPTTTTIRWKGWICPRPPRPCLPDYRPTHQRPIQVHLSPSFLLQPFDLTIVRLKLSIRPNRLLLCLLSQIYLFQRNLLQSRLPKRHNLNIFQPQGQFSLIVL